MKHFLPSSVLKLILGVIVIATFFFYDVLVSGFIFVILFNFSDLLLDRNYFGPVLSGAIAAHDVMLRIPSTLLLFDHTVGIG
jgi:hypothetical protein